MKFSINAKQHFYLKLPNFQEIRKIQSVKIFIFKKKCHYFCTGVYILRMDDVPDALDTLCTKQLYYFLGFTAQWIEPSPSVPMLIKPV